MTRRGHAARDNPTRPRATTKLVDAGKLPDQTVVVRFELRDRPGDNYRLLLRKPTPELCTKGTG